MKNLVRKSNLQSWWWKTGVFGTLLLLIFYVTSCSKPEIKQDLGPVYTPPQRYVLDRNEADISISEGKLKFRDMETYNQKLEQIRSNTVDQNIAWSESLDFKSIRYYYQKAMSDLACETEDCPGIQQLPSQYIGKVIFDGENINPILPSISNGWLLSLDGSFFIGQTLVHFTKDHVFSITNNYQSKLAIAKETLESDFPNGIYVHPIEVSDSRGECCPNLLTCPQINSTPNKYRIKNASSAIVDESVAYWVEPPSGNAGWVVGIWYYQRLYFHHQRKTWAGWTVCDRTFWSYDSDVKVTWLGAPLLGGPNSTTIATGSTHGMPLSLSKTGLEYKYEREQTILSAVSAPKVAVDTRAICITEHLLNVTALKSPLKTSNRCKM
jgi:hypothetical protein